MTAPLTLPAALADAVRKAAEAVGLTPQAYIEQKLADAVRRDAQPKRIRANCCACGSSRTRRHTRPSTEPAAMSGGHR